MSELKAELQEDVIVENRRIADHLAEIYYADKFIVSNTEQEQEVAFALRESKDCFMDAIVIPLLEKGIPAETIKIIMRSEEFRQEIEDCVESKKSVLG
jgi:hypothetical protein